MNKYGVILIGGTIGSVFAGGNCSGKENEDEMNFKKLVCECFKDIADSNFLHVMSFNITNINEIRDEGLSEMKKITDQEILKKIAKMTHILLFTDGNKSFIGFMNLDKSKKILPTEKVDIMKKTPTKEECKNGFFVLLDMEGGNVNNIGQFIVKDDSKAPAAA